jgi:flagellar basal body-associated protein FliL
VSPPAPEEATVVQQPSSPAPPPAPPGPFPPATQGPPAGQVSPGAPHAGDQQPVPAPPGWGQTAPTPVDPLYQPPQDPFHTTTMTPDSARLPHGPYDQQPPGQQPPGQQPPGQQPLGQQPPKKNKGLVITAIVLGVALLLCAVGGVGAFLLLRNTEGKGALTAKDAAQEFLTAVYKDHKGEAAEKLVCGEARDRKAIDKKINEVKSQKEKLKGPSITWDNPRIENETATQADTTVTVKLTTSDEKLAEQTIKLTLVKRDGWFVCEVQEQKK